MRDVYITTHAPRAMAVFIGYIRDAATHEILGRTAVAAHVDTAALAHEHARVRVSTHAYEWRLVAPPRDAPPLFEGDAR